MKNTIFIAILSFLASCNNNEDVKTENQIQGKWFMENISCICPGVNDYSEEFILWNINTENNTINVVNYYTTDFHYLNTGEYEFTNNNNTITIVNGNANLFFDYRLENNKLTLSNQPELDGPLITFNPKETVCIDNPLENLVWFDQIAINADQIIQYEYNNQCVYLVDDCYDCSDKLVQVYNTEGEIICQFGGIQGLNTCPDFFDTATHKRYLFNNVED